jgi:hypothetical protein
MFDVDASAASVVPRCSSRDSSDGRVLRDFCYSKASMELFACLLRCTRTVVCPSVRRLP